MALMSASPPPSVPAQPRYRRTTGGLVAAMVITLGAVLAFVAFRGLTRDNQPTPVQTVDYTRTVQLGRKEGLLAMLAPARLPRGWRATSAAYLPGPAPTWHLGLLTAGQKYVGVEEARATVDEMVRKHVDENATRDGSVQVGGARWQVWRDAAGDYAVVRTLRGPKREQETVLVVGSAPEEQVRQLAASLQAS
jgi:hypothetical protein